MTPQQTAEAITGCKDDGGICTPNSKMGVTRQIAQAIKEAIAAERERCARAAEWYNNVEQFTAAQVASRIRKATD